MNDSIYRISLDMHDTGSQTSLSAKKGDKYRSLHITLTENGKPYKIAEGCCACFEAKKPDNNYIHNACEIKGNTIVYGFTTQTTAAVGTTECEITLYDSELCENKITSPRFSLVVEDTVYNGEEIVSSPEADALKDLIGEANELIVTFKNKILDYITYEIIDNSVTITGCDKSISGAHIIPDTIEGYPVTKIGEAAFHNCDKLKSIIIPESVTVLKPSAFVECDSLERVNIPNNVTSLNATFGMCSSLRKIKISNNVISINQAFAFCNNLNIYYDGTKEEWDRIEKSEYGSELTDATIHFNNSYETYSKAETDEIKSVANEALNIAKGKSQAYVFDTKEKLDTKISRINNFIQPLTEGTFKQPSTDDMGDYSYTVKKSETLQGSYDIDLSKATFAVPILVLYTFPCSSLTESFVLKSNYELWNNMNIGYDFENGIYTWNIPAGEYDFGGGSICLTYSGNITNFWATLSKSDNVAPTPTTYVSWCPYNVGDNLYIKDINVPDYWWDGIGVSKLETQKVDLTEYYTKSETDQALTEKADKSTTLSGYGIENAYTRAQVDNLLGYKASNSSVYSKSEIDSKLNKKVDKATTLSGYGITDAYTKAETDQALSGKADKNKILDYITYQIINDSVTITDCDTSISGAHIIPEIIEGYPVTVIGNAAFSKCSGLVSITIPNSVIDIGESAFSGCTTLESLVIPDGITIIKSDSIPCECLKRLYLPDSILTIEDGIFPEISESHSIDVYYNGTREQWGKIEFTGLANEGYGAYVTLHRKYDDIPMPIKNSDAASKEYVDESLENKADKPSWRIIEDGETVTLADNTNYYVEGAISNLTINYPVDAFICSLELPLASSGDITITLPQSKYIGGTPTFANGETWELNIKNGVVVGGLVE